jgi:hypothetical protein
MEGIEDEALAMTDGSQNIAWSASDTPFGAEQMIATPSKAGFAGANVTPPPCPIGRRDPECIARRHGPSAIRA